MPFSEYEFGEGVFARIRRGHVVISGHMLGLDLEREEYRVRAVSYCYGDPSFNYVYSFVCVYYSIVKS